MRVVLVAKVPLVSSQMPDPTGVASMLQELQELRQFRDRCRSTEVRQTTEGASVVDTMPTMLLNVPTGFRNALETKTDAAVVTKIHQIVGERRFEVGEFGGDVRWETRGRIGAYHCSFFRPLRVLCSRRLAQLLP